MNDSLTSEEKSFPQPGQDPQCEVHRYLMGDGHCTCKPVVLTSKKDVEPASPSKRLLQEQVAPSSAQALTFARLIELIRMSGENRNVSAFWADCETALIELRDVRDPDGVAPETSEHQPVAWRCKNGFGEWHFTTVKPNLEIYGFWEPVYVANAQKAGEQLKVGDSVSLHSVSPFGVPQDGWTIKALPEPSATYTLVHPSGGEVVAERFAFTPNAPKAGDKA
jgi:hypothetical protein